MDNPEFWKPIWDFLENLVSDTLAPWVNRALPHLVSPTVKLVRTHTSRVRRVAAGQGREVMALLREAPQSLRNPWLWPLFLTLTTGVGMGNTRWAETVEIAGGAIVSLYVCAAVYFIIRGGVERVANKVSIEW